MARCPVCKASIEYLVSHARDAHVLECAERLDVVANGNGEGVKCAICGKSLAHLNAQRRAQHADRCGTKLDKAHGGEVNGAVFFCVMCEENLSERDESYRTRHLKRCAATRQLAPKHVRQLVDARRQANSEFDVLLQNSAANASTSVDAIGILERNRSAGAARRANTAAELSAKRRRRERSPLTLEEEDLALARALSLSEASNLMPLSSSPPPPPPPPQLQEPSTPPRLLLSPQLPQSRFAQPNRSLLWNLNSLSSAPESQVDTLARITANIGASLEVPPVDSPRATLSQLVNAATSDVNDATVVAVPQDDDRPDDEVDAVAPERAAVLIECDALVQERRELMLARCSEWQRQIEAERLECLSDIVALQRSRDERLAELDDGADVEESIATL